MKKKILKTAFISSPIITFLLLAPLFVFKSENSTSDIFIFFSVLGVTLLHWLTNYFLLISIKKRLIRISISFGLCFLFLCAIPTIINFKKIILINLNFNISQFYIIRCLIFLAINALIIIFIDLIESKEKQLILINNIATLKYVNLEAQYKLLKDQINPHFLFNSLSTLKALIKRQPEAAQQYVILLADLMRSSIDFNSKSITLSEELKLCANYIALQKFSYGEAVLYSTNILEEHYNKELPYFALVSLIENATKHNSFTVEKPLNLKIFFDENYIVVQNNKQPRFINYSGKTGLLNINERSKMLNGNEIQIIDEKVSFTVKIKL
jgi:sensor histidine kinase YesM